MDEAKRKPIMIGIIVVCLGLAAYITFGGGGAQKIEETPEDAMVWMKCVNPRCNSGTTVFELNKREYQAFQKEHIEEETTPPLDCQKCGKLSAFLAKACPKCGNVFMSGEAGRTEISDRCPKCKYSAREEAKNKEQPSKPSKPSKPLLDE